MYDRSWICKEQSLKLKEIKPKWFEICCSNKTNVAKRLYEWLKSADYTIDIKMITFKIRKQLIGEQWLLNLSTTKLAIEEKNQNYLKSADRTKPTWQRGGIID